jgi:DNA-binding response OmpR family regulator
MRILLIEDDKPAAKSLIKSLQKYDITAEWLRKGGDAFPALTTMDLVLLDLSLPDIDGVTVCRAIRSISDVPLVILTGCTEIKTRVRALRAGADDYLTKPVNPAELVARINAVIRRARSADRQATVRIADIDIDLARQAVRVGGVDVTTTRKEFQLLALLADQEGRVCPRERLIAQIWGRPWPGANDTLNVHVAMLRAKIGRPELIQTVRGIGYRLRPDRRNERLVRCER